MAFGHSTGWSSKRHALSRIFFRDPHHPSLAASCGCRRSFYFTWRSQKPLSGEGSRNSKGQGNWLDTVAAPSKEEYEANPFRAHSRPFVGSRPPVHRHPAADGNRGRLLQVSLRDCMVGRWNCRHELPTLTRETHHFPAADIEYAVARDLQTSLTKRSVGVFRSRIVTPSGSPFYRSCRARACRRWFARTGR
jgi:hypothetical protein